MGRCAILHPQSTRFIAEYSNPNLRYAVPEALGSVWPTEPNRRRQQGNTGALEVVRGSGGEYLTLLRSEWCSSGPHVTGFYYCLIRSRLTTRTASLEKRYCMPLQIVVVATVHL